MLNEELKKLMEKRGITQKKLSEMTGISKASIHNYVAGKFMPRENHRKKIEDALRDPCSTGKEAESKKEQLFFDKKITVEKAARIMHVSEKNLYKDIRDGIYPFAKANKSENSSKWRYVIFPKLFYEYTGYRH